jgi:hypothetical protein
MAIAASLFPRLAAPPPYRRLLLQRKMHCDTDMQPVFVTHWAAPPSGEAQCRSWLCYAPVL